MHRSAPAPVLSALAALLLSACAGGAASGGATEPSEPVAGSEAAPWTYRGGTGPERWAELSPAYAACAEGRLQSPVALSDDAAARRSEAAVSPLYASANLTPALRGPILQADFPPGLSLAADGRTWPLERLELRTPAEHSVNGREAPLAVHFHHFTARGDRLVLAVRFAEGAANPALGKLLGAAPDPRSGDEARTVRLDPRQLLPADLRTYSYSGSLTAPPCTEGVAWHVAKGLLTASAEQIAAARALTGANARPPQSAAAREITAPR